MAAVALDSVAGELLVLAIAVVAAGPDLEGSALPGPVAPS